LKECGIEIKSPRLCDSFEEIKKAKTDPEVSRNSLSNNQDVSKELSKDDQDKFYNGIRLENKPALVKKPSKDIPWNPKEEAK